MAYVIRNDQYADETTVGLWDGHEEQAAAQFNKILEEIARRLNDADDSRFEAFAKWAWDRVGSDEDLLTYTDEQIANIVEDLMI